MLAADSDLTVAALPTAKPTPYCLSTAPQAKRRIARSFL